eukprot:TRINITY_DN43547_c0_g1_i1.p1 TRINITY_DN43547_c0_g1~~TRINITY_DN43547_c0_g1_i1.p1  ORF type:complete len:528 (-),score=94.15 TRINITY_DN43547_c0_g1_i1:49-1581(-)
MALPRLRHDAHGGHIFRLLLAATCCPCFVPAADISLYVRSQGVPHHKAALDELIAQVVEAGWPHTSVVSMADAENEFLHKGLWSYLPWIWQSEQRLAATAGKKQRRKAGSASGQRWVVFLEPATGVDAKALEALLSGYDAKESVYLGHALKDEQMCIIHHYQQEPAYPLGHAGFALSGGALKRLVQDLEAKPITGGQQIEPVWELADRLHKIGVNITDRKDAFCRSYKDGCSSWVRDLDPFRSSWSLRPKDVLISVKTVGKFHQERIPLLQEFWASQSPVEVVHLSNEAYDALPGVKVVDLSKEFGDMVDPAKESTKSGSGHCSKMLAILRYLQRHQPGRRWYAITDDDTLLNVPRLLRVLDSHDDRKAVYLGERYGWNHREGQSGTNYVTTGGGMVLSGPALEKVVACDWCSCASPSSPDDMTLGSWFRGLEVEAVHEEGFHQSEPNNYHQEVLRASDPVISFHRYNARLPGSSSKEEYAKARRNSWASWVKQYFSRSTAPSGVKAEEL